MNKYLFQLNHPAHFHLFKNVISELRKLGHDVLITNRDKDVLENLLKNEVHYNISTRTKKTLGGKVFNLINREKALNKIIRRYKPDVLLGTSPEIAHLGTLNKIPSIFFGEDDVTLSPIMYLGALGCYPLFSCILSPQGVNNSIWNKKTIFYNGFQKLAYLHPLYFQPDRGKVELSKERPYFMLRFASLNAKGINDELAKKIIEILESKGDVYISAERGLPPELEKYRFKGNKQDIHHYLYYADLFIGDSQSMAVESAMLGTPNIRFNDFVGKISVLEEIENKYKLSIGINSSNAEALLKEVSDIIANPSIRSVFQQRREKMLSEKINVTKFIVWFIENYPQSKQKMKINPDYQKNYK